MEPRRLVAPLVAAVAIVALVAADWVPALRGAPLILFVVLGAVQIDRELANGLSTRSIYPSAPMMNLLVAMVLLHVAYFRSEAGSTFLELVNTILLAMFTLVVFAAFYTDIREHGLFKAVRNELVALLITVAAAGGFAFALLLETLPDPAGAVRAPGAALVAVVLAGAWLGLGAGRRLDRADVGYPRPTGAGHLARFAGTAIVVTAGVVALGAGVRLTALAALLMGVGAGVGAVIGYELVRRLAVWFEVESFRWRLPQQVDFMQSFYDRLFPGGLTDYAGALVPVFPLVYLAARGMIR